jgi:hypothetical protein
MWLAVGGFGTTMKNARRGFVVALLLTGFWVASAAAQSRHLDSYVLFALEGIRTKGLTLSSGDIGVNDPDGAISASSHGVIDAPQSDLVAGMVRASVKSRCLHLYANLAVGTMPACQPNGGFRALALPLMADPLAESGYPAPFPDLCAGAAPVIVTLDTTRTLPPGTYGDVNVFSAGGRVGRLVLTGGDYFFCSLRTGRSAQVLFQGPSTLRVRNLVNLGASAYLGPDPAAGSAPSAGDIVLHVNGPAVHFSATSDVHARLLAPNAMLRVTHEATIEGSFMARAIRTERIGGGPPTTTTTTSTTTTSQARLTTTSRGATTTTRPGDCRSLCGNGHIDPACDEQCDGNDFGGETCPGGSLHCRPDCTIDFSGCPTTTTTLPGGPREICGNCIDDDGNGLTDFEDPACCAGAQSFGITVRRGRLKPRGTATRLRLKTKLAQSGLENVNPLKQDVFLQIRPAGGTDVLCAQVPAEKFMRMHGAFKFWDRKHTVASAKGIDDLKIKVRKDGSVRLKTVGRRVRFQTPQQASLQVTVGFRDPATAEAGNRCSTETRAFRTGRSGRLIFP